MKRLFISLCLLAIASSGQSRSRRGDYALILEDAPAAQKAESRAGLRGPAALAQLQKIRAAQGGVLAELQRRKVPVTSSSQVLVNAIFVHTTRETALTLRDIAGVAHVVYLPPIKRDLNTAVGLVNVPNAWNAFGGPSNAGAGMKIGIIDTGIDQNHPGFQDPSLQAPSGFPKGDSGYTNSKVIVARSYVTLLYDPDPAYSSPDDTTPRDRVGHGTAIAMIAAGVQNSGPAATIQGVAPKAFLGNYKVFGSPGVNDYSNDAAVVQALKDAFDDGMDIVTLSLNGGNIATYAPLDVDSNPNGCGGQCDVIAQAVESAVSMGLTVVTSAGNDGNAGMLPVTLDSLHTPGTAPSAITVGASTNSHVFYQAVHAGGPNVPSSLQNVRALFGDGPQPQAAISGPVVDVAQLGNDGLACSALPAGSISGKIALVQRGTCTFSDKINNAQAAGALGVIIYQSSGIDTIYSSLGAQDTGEPAVMIGNTDGSALKSYADANSGATATLDPTRTAVNSTADQVAAFSSQGPSIGSFGATPTFVIKPELVAPGDNLYTAAQKLDPNGDAYDATGYTNVSGTSYSVPMVAGAAAMAKQKNSNLNTPGRLKSAVVNTATPDVKDASGNQVRVNAVGAGKLSAADALNVAATIEPATLSFGNITTSTVDNSLKLVVTNVGSAVATYNFEVHQRVQDNNASVDVSPSSLTLQPNTNNNVSLRLHGNQPLAGAYEGYVKVTAQVGGQTTGPVLQVPYLYMVGSGIPTDIFPVINGSFIGAPGDTNWLIGFKLIDQYGVPITSQPVVFAMQAGGGTVSQADGTTDRTGIAAALVNLGSQTGDQIFTATAGGLTVTFNGSAQALPSISSNGVVDAASNRVGQGFAPGSYISIYGSNLTSGSTAQNSTSSLPVSLASVSVSFDGGGMSLPGHLYYAGPGQINVQIPWEFQGQTTVSMKVTLYGKYGLTSNTYNVPLATYSPGVFAVVDQAGKTIGQGAVVATRGQTILVFANGLGAVSNQPASGDPGPAQPLAHCSVLPSVAIGGSTAQVDFCGLAPGFVGLYQLNVEVPAGAPTGTQPLVVTVNNVSSQAVNLPVQ